MPTGFKWELGDYVGGSFAVHPNYKQYLAVETPGHDQQAVGEITIQPGQSGQIQISGLGFTPTALVMVSYRPQNANGVADNAFGDRGGGMTFGCAGWETGADEWEPGTYNTGEFVMHEAQLYECVAPGPGFTTTDEPPSADWAEVLPTQFTGSTKIRHAFETVYAIWREDVCFNVMHKGFTALTLSLDSFDVGGFTLNIDLNLYDQSNPVAWLAIGGNNTVGIMDAGQTEITGFNGTPSGAMFLSIKLLESEAGIIKSGYWDHMTGFASPGEGAVVWGGAIPTSWTWTTERWEDAYPILLCRAASGTSFAGTQIEARGQVTDWVPGGIELQWPVFNNQPYRIGYLLVETGDAGWFEANAEKKPGGIEVGPDGVTNFENTTVRPDLVLMASTNYTFNGQGGVTYDDFPRLPNQFQFCGGGGLGFHASPYSRLGFDAYGVHTYGNAVAERGHYANSGTQYLRRWIMAGQGCTSQPPANHQHSINIVPNPVIVGINYRYAERHAHVKRIHVNPSDRYIP